MAGNVGTGQAPRATSEESADGAAAWPGFEPTRRAKLAARTVSGRAGPTAPGTSVGETRVGRAGNQWPEASKSNRAIEE